MNFAEPFYSTRSVKPTTINCHVIPTTRRWKEDKSMYWRSYPVTRKQYWRTDSLFVPFVPMTDDEFNTAAALHSNTKYKCMHLYWENITLTYRKAQLFQNVASQDISWHFHECISSQKFPFFIPNTDLNQRMSVFESVRLKHWFFFSSSYDLPK